MLALAQTMSDTDRALADASTMWQMVPGAVLVREGHVLDQCFGVVQGLVELSYSGAGGANVVVDVIGSDDWFGCSHLLAAHRSTFTARCLGPSTLRLLRRPQLQRLVDARPEMHEWLRAQALRRAERLSKRMALFAMASIEDRFQALVEEHGEVLWRLNLTQAELGRLIGASRQRTNELLVRLRREPGKRHG